MLRVVIDTGVLFRGIKELEEGNGDSVARSCATLLETLDEDDGTFMVFPPPVVTEYLAGLKAEDHTDAMRKLNDVGELPSLLPGCAQKAGELARLVFDQQGKADRDAAGRHCAKFDALILGAAESQGIKYVISLDGSMKNLAQRGNLSTQVWTPDEFLLRR